MANNPEQLTKSLLEGSVPALARVLSLIEDGGARGQQCLKLLYPHTGNIRVIGVTGSPGAGKSTLVNGLAEELVKGGKRVAILAVDPSSPYSGGAILGDRIRMSSAASDSGIFIRSMATRGALGGLAPNAAESIFALDAAGFDYVILETVGVGQAEVEIVGLADTVVLVLVPGMGDGVQALKAGIIEIADIYAINKSDFDGVEKLVKELRTVMSLAENVEWEQPLVKVIATEKKGIADLVEKIAVHQKWSEESGEAQKRRGRFVGEVVEKRLGERLFSHAKDRLSSDGELDRALQQVSTREIDPVAAVERLMKSLNIN